MSHDEAATQTTPICSTVCKASGQKETALQWGKVNRAAGVEGLKSCMEFLIRLPHGFYPIVLLVTLIH